MYITFEEYMSMYDLIDEHVFNLLAFDVCRVMDKRTTGVDNVKKLREFFPVDSYDAMAVKMCAGKLINFMYQIRQAEDSLAESSGYESTEMGLRGKVISSVTAGNESISYSTGNAASTAIDSAVKDRKLRREILDNIVSENLSGVKDANGVNLLFMGRYPHACRHRHTV